MWGYPRPLTTCLTSKNKHVSEEQLLDQLDPAAGMQ